LNILTRKISDYIKYGGVRTRTISMLTDKFGFSEYMQHPSTTRRSYQNQIRPVSGLAHWL